MIKIAKSAIIYPNVKIGDGTIIEDNCIIGILPSGKTHGNLETEIGKNCLIRSGTYIYAGNSIGDYFQTGNKVNIRENNEIGDYVSIGTLSVIEHHVKIEDYVRIHSQAFIPEYSILKQGCWIGPNVVLTNCFHPLCPNAKDCLHGPTIEENVKVGANTTILPNIKIGRNSLIGAGSVIVNDISANSVVAGNPARFIKNVEDLKCHFGRRDKPYK